MLPLSTAPHMLRRSLNVILIISLCLGFFLIISKVRASTSPLAGWRLDFSPPTVAITSPEDGATVSGTISIDVNARDDGAIRLVKLYKDGQLFGQDALPPYTFLWSAALEPAGSSILTAVAVDTSGNTSISGTINVTVTGSGVTTRPDIVVVITDDQRWDTMQYMPLTNSLLFADSIRFSNAIAAVPLCCPSRSSIFTGLYSHNHGVLDNELPYGGAPNLDDSSTIATWLDSAGYQTGLFGKYLNYYDRLLPDKPIPPGWDQFFAFLNNNGNYYNYSLAENGETVLYGKEPEDYATDVIADQAIDFINNADPEDPIFLYLAPFAPHSRAAAVDSLPVPGPGDAGSYADLPPWRPATYNEADVSDKPLWVRNLELLTPEQMEKGDQFRIHQIESLQAVDRAVGDVIEALVQTGRYENTVFVFLSDNGLSWGEHRWSVKKWCVYEECIRIPFWMRVPGVAGRDETALVNDVDLGPTLAELAGALPPTRADGRPLNGLSLVDRIVDPLAPWRTENYTEYLGPVAGGSKMIFRAVRTEEYKYVEYDTGDREFYDLSVDPLEERNLAGDQRYQQTVLELQKALEILKEE